MDRTDYKILNILQTDSRTTLKDIGDHVGLTAPAVSERIRKMEEHGVIRGYHIDIDRESLDCNMTGFILVAPNRRSITASATSVPKIPPSSAITM